MRHAFLITAYNNFDILSKNLELLDDERNLIFLHVDKKKKEIPKIVMKNAKLFQIPSQNVSWGAYR